MCHIIRKTLIKDIVNKKITKNKAKNMSLNINIVFQLRMMEYWYFGKDFCRCINAFLTSKVRKSISKKLAITKSKIWVFLNLVKFGFLDQANL